MAGGWWGLQLVLVCVPILSALWVLQDARNRIKAGRRVGVYVRSFALETPEAWAVACLLLWLFVLPLYLQARSQS